VLHIHGLGFDGLTGYSVAHLARESIGAALAAEKSGAALFGNSSRPDAVLEHPGVMGDTAHKMLRKEWEAKYRGPENAHRLAILEEGITFKAISIPNKDAQWIEARQFMVSELCRWLRIPPHKVHDLTHGTYTNIQHQAIEYVVDTLQPWLIRWEQEIARKLIPKRAPLFAEHLVDGLLRGDTEARFKAYRTAILSGWMSRNEARELENMNPREGLDTFLEPLNTGPVGGGD
jgi:HK97 family phage portal protein